MRTITVLDYLENNKKVRPDNIAVIEENNRLTYAELSEKALDLANGINKKMAGKCKLPVVIFMDKGIDHLITMYGSLYCGNFYVPMDIKTPIERLESILSTLGEYIVVTSKRYEKNLLDTGFTGDYNVLEELMSLGGNYDLEKSGDTDAESQKYVSNRSVDDNEKLARIKASIIDTDLMYLIFTSGSTGTPKGVAIMHRSLIDYVDAFLDCIGMSEDDVCGNQAPFYADMSDRELFMTVATGATLCIIPQKLFMLPKKLLQYMEDNGVTFTAWVPTAYRIVMQFDGLNKVKPSKLRRILFSGEGMPIPVFNYWKEHFPEATFIQSYGPTEITGSCTYFFADGEYSDGDTIPIGKKFRNTGIILLDENDRIIPESEAGIPGEICVYGTCLAAGYYNNPEKTKEAFVDLPVECGYGQKMYRTGDLAKWDKDANIVFISRKDYQIKHMGKRIELGEIETAMASVHEIKACCCAHNRKKDALVLYYVGDITNKEIIDRIGNKLPNYMIPASYVQMEDLPQLPNGKVNRKLLDTMANE